jgi:hypothetical protein
MLISIPFHRVETTFTPAFPLLARRSLFLTFIALACLALSPHAGAQTQCRDGCDGNNTFQGDRALYYNTTGVFNTAFGFDALLKHHRREKHSHRY